MTSEFQMTLKENKEKFYFLFKSSFFSLFKWSDFTIKTKIEFELKKIIWKVKNGLQIGMFKVKYSNLMSQWEKLLI